MQLKIAHPLSTVRYNSWEDLIKQLEQLIEEWRPDRLVVGIPVRQDDSEHELAKEIRNFSKNLGDLFAMPVVLLDESYTSVESENFLFPTKFIFSISTSIKLPTSIVLLVDN